MIMKKRYWYDIKCTVHHCMLRMRDTANWWAGLLACVYSWSPAISSWRVWHGLATAVDNMGESIHNLRCDFLCLQDTERESEPAWGKPVLISILAFSLMFHAVTLDRRENPIYVSTYNRRIPGIVCGAIHGSCMKWYVGQTDTHDNYSNPRCACTPRVNGHTDTVCHKRIHGY